MELWQTFPFLEVWTGWTHLQPGVIDLLMRLCCLADLWLLAVAAGCAFTEVFCSCFGQVGLVLLNFLVFRDLLQRRSPVGGRPWPNAISRGPGFTSMPCPTSLIQREIAGGLEAAESSGQERLLVPPLGAAVAILELLDLVLEVFLKIFLVGQVFLISFL